jgi:hypothetical protein
MDCWMGSGIVSPQVCAWLMCFGEGGFVEVENGVRGRYQPEDSSTPTGGAESGPSLDKLKSAIASSSIKT